MLIFVMLFVLINPQANGLVPIVEPEILMDGDHDLVCENFSLFSYFFVEIPY
jgi:hypothetical protein